MKTKGTTYNIKIFAGACGPTLITDFITPETKVISKMRRISTTQAERLAKLINRYQDKGQCAVRPFLTGTPGWAAERHWED